MEGTLMPEPKGTEPHFHIDQSEPLLLLVPKYEPQTSKLQLGQSAIAKKKKRNCDRVRKQNHKITKSKNIQQQGFAFGHPPYY